MRGAPSDREVRDFRARLFAAFPSRPFHEVVSTHDECDDGVYLHRELSGRRWDQLSPEVIFQGSIALPLLEPEALTSFLPAWLLRSMETLDRQSIVLEFTLYFLCPGSEDQGWNEKDIAELTVLFNPVQKSLIAYLLRAVLSDTTMKYWHGCADFGLRWWGAGGTSESSVL